MKYFFFLLFQSSSAQSDDFGYTVMQTSGIGDSLKNDYPNFGPGTQQFA